MGSLHGSALPEAACPQAGCLLESLDAGGMALDCGMERGDGAERDPAGDGMP
jgi:hypothetical protein